MRMRVLERLEIIFLGIFSFLPLSPYHSSPDGFVSAGIEPRNLPIKLFQKILRDVNQNPPYVLSHLLHPSLTANRRDEQQ